MVEIITAIGAFAVGAVATLVAAAIITLIAGILASSLCLVEMELG